MIETALTQLLQHRQEQGLFRQRVLYPKNVLNFSTNDYLCLVENQRIKQAFQKAYDDFPCGSTGSLSICGYHEAHKRLERAFCERLQVEDGLLFSSGYAANLAVMALLTQLNCHVFIDKCLHASFYDGIQLANTSYTRYLHNDVNDLKAKLGNNEFNKAIITEGIFSMSGQRSDLITLGELARASRAICIIDEAHSFGVQGAFGLGAVYDAQLTSDQVPLRVIPFGKALASQGAIVVGKKDYIDGLFQFARSNIYSTGMSPALAAGLLTSLEVVGFADEERKNLQAVIACFRNKIAQSNLIWRSSNTAIQQLQLGCPEKALRFTAALLEQNIVCMAMRQPTVSRKETGLRIVLNCRHEEKQIDRLLDCLESLNDS